VVPYPPTWKSDRLERANVFAASPVAEKQVEREHRYSPIAAQCCAIRMVNELLTTNQSLTREFCGVAESVDTDLTLLSGSAAKLTGDAGKPQTFDTPWWYVLAFSGGISASR